MKLLGFLALFSGVVLGVAVYRIDAQATITLTPCRTLGVPDSERRTFNRLESFNIDIDQDGKLETVTPRTYITKVQRKDPGEKRVQNHEDHWIAFDLRYSSGKTIKSFFKYKYGSDWADYWVYALVPCKGKPGLVKFYSGDDTSEEQIILRKRRTRFSVISKRSAPLS